MDTITETPATPSLDEKVAFLATAAAHPGHAGPITRRETHMSWLFFLDGAVYKLKKPVRFPYLDFSTLARREAACRAELALNQRLAPDVYEAVVPLVTTGGGMSIGGAGEVVDWLVRMRRFDPARTLEARLAAGVLTARELATLGGFLARFYRQAERVRLTPAGYLRGFRQGLAYHRASSWIDAWACRAAWSAASWRFSSGSCARMGIFWRRGSGGPGSSMRTATSGRSTSGWGRRSR